MVEERSSPVEIILASLRGDSDESLQPADQFFNILHGILKQFRIVSKEFLGKEEMPFAESGKQSLHIFFMLSLSLFCQRTQ